MFYKNIRYLLVIFINVFTTHEKKFSLTGFYWYVCNTPVPNESYFNLTKIDLINNLISYLLKIQQLIAPKIAMITKNMCKYAVGLYKV